VTTLQRYTLREILAPTALGLIVFTFVFLVGQLFKLAEMLLNSGIPANIALELIALLMPGVMAVTIPMALLVGVLLGVGRLAADREILAIKASGISLVHLAKPIVGFTIVVSGLMMWANMKLIPYLNLKSSDLQVQILFHALSAIPAGSPFELPTEGQDQDTTILIDSKEKGTGRLQGVTMLTQFESSKKPGDLSATINDLNTTAVKEALAGAAEKDEKPAEADKKPKKKETKEDRIEERRRKQEEDWKELLTTPVQDVVILAQEGAFEPKIDERVVYVRLLKGSIQMTDPQNPGAYDVIHFDTLTKGIVPTFSRIEKGFFEKAPREMSTGELRQQIQSRDKGRKYSTELYQRFSVPLACIAFALIAFPLAVYVRPTGKAVAFAISFILILFYYGLMEYGVALSHANNFLGPVAIFLPNAIIAGIGCFMLYRIVTR
jgi:lipopolysaccharide export LptBFGC system permease protein LptF